MIRAIIGVPIAKIGAYLWQPAFDKGYEDNYDQLTILEKLGFNLMMLGLKIIGITTKEDVERIVASAK